MRTFCATLLDARGLTDQERRRRRLGDEGERAVLEDRDLGRDHEPALVLGRGVVRLAEVHDVDAVRAERGADRRRRRGLPGLDLDLDTVAASFFLAIELRRPCSRLELGDLAELELDRGLPTEDVDEHLELRAVDVDLGDRTVEVGERAGDDADLLALLELDARPHLLLDRRPALGFSTPRMSSTSLRDSGVGLAPLGPTKPVTPGVLRTTYQESSSRSMRTSR